MTAFESAIFESAIKERGESCEMFKCPNFASLCGINEDGTLYFGEGDRAYRAAVYCTNQTLMGIGNGACLIAQRADQASNMPTIETVETALALRLEMGNLTSLVTNRIPNPLEYVGYVATELSEFTSETIENGVQNATT